MKQVNCLFGSGANVWKTSSSCAGRDESVSGVTREDGSEIEPKSIHTGSFTSGRRCPLPCMTPFSSILLAKLKSGISRIEHFLVTPETKFFINGNKGSFTDVKTGVHVNVKSHSGVDADRVDIVP
jgi:hypothetical protein